MTTAYNKLLKRIADLSDEGEVDKAKFAEYKTRFEDALCDDLNSSMAITVLYEMLKADMNDKTKRELVKSFPGFTVRQGYRQHGGVRGRRIKGLCAFQD